MKTWSSLLQNLSKCPAHHPLDGRVGVPGWNFLGRATHPGLGLGPTLSPSRPPAPSPSGHARAPQRRLLMLSTQKRSPGLASSGRKPLNPAVWLRLDRF